jgi:hypothetical protein
MISRRVWNTRKRFVRLAAGEIYRWPSLILCEGEKDVLFFRAIRDKLRKPYLHIEHTGSPREKAGGNKKFRQRLKALKGATDFQKVKHILLVSDNDDSFDTSFGEICSQVEAAGFGPAPKQPLERAQTDPSITIMMLPLDRTPGTLETVCRPAAEAAVPRLVQPVDQFLAVLNSDAWAAARKSKAWLRAYLAGACERDPFISFGNAVDPAEKLIPLDHKSFESIIAEVAKLP